MARARIDAIAASRTARPRRRLVEAVQFAVARAYVSLCRDTTHAHGSIPEYIINSVDSVGCWLTRYLG
jgi:hypothetical protein